MTDSNTIHANTETATKKKSKPALWPVVKSILAAGIGVQSNKNRERDFKYGNIYVYIVSGLIFTIMFIFTVVSVVKLVIHNAGM